VSILDTCHVTHPEKNWSHCSQVMVAKTVNNGLCRSCCWRRGIKFVRNRGAIWYVEIFCTFVRRGFTYTTCSRFAPTSADSRKYHNGSPRFSQEPSRHIPTSFFNIWYANVLLLRANGSLNGGVKLQVYEQRESKACPSTANDYKYLERTLIEHYLVAEY
jgi:hypothetical protein